MIIGVVMEKHSSTKIRNNIWINPDEVAVISEWTGGTSITLKGGKEIHTGWDIKDVLKELGLS